MASKPKKESPHKDSQEKKTLGRPTKYKPEYCQMLVEHMASGLSFTSFAAVIDVNEDTLHEWVKVHEDFSDTKKQAFSKNKLFWEKKGIEGLWGDKMNVFNSTVWIFNMKNRFPVEWRDKKEIELEHSASDKLVKVFKTKFGSKAEPTDDDSESGKANS